MLSSLTAPAVRANSAPTLPLAIAAARLRGRPGRPRKASRVTPGVTSPRPAPRERPQVPVPAAPAPSSPSAHLSGGLPPRLLSVKAAAAYLGVSGWMVRRLIEEGALQPVQLLPGARRVLLDVRQLDQLVDACRVPSA